MTETIRTSTAKPGPHAHAPSAGGISANGLKGGQFGLLAVVVLGISTIAPAYTLTSALGPTVNEAGLQLPVIFLIGFIPMILVSLAYRELNADSPDSGTTFTWVTKAFGPWIGWMGGWGLLAANMMFAGVGDTGNGLNNAENHENIFTALASPIMGPFAILMSLAVLSSSAASLQSTFMSPSRSLLAMAHYGALPEPFSRISRKFATPGFATVAAGVMSAGFYAVMHVVSENVLNDTILALGLMICFYYGLTAMACTWYFRHSLFNSMRHFVFRLVCPVLGGVGLFVVFVQTAMDSLAPEFGSGSEIFGVGLVFILGVGILALGAVVMLVMARTHPGFFRGETLRQDTPALVVPE